MKQLRHLMVDRKQLNAAFETHLKCSLLQLDIETHYAAKGSAKEEIEG